LEVVYVAEEFAQGSQRQTLTLKSCSALIQALSAVRFWLSRIRGAA